MGGSTSMVEKSTSGREPETTSSASSSEKKGKKYNNTWRVSTANEKNTTAQVDRSNTIDTAPTPSTGSAANTISLDGIRKYTDVTSTCGIDTFQIGRSSSFYGNDIVIKGRVHEGAALAGGSGSDGIHTTPAFSSPVSRFACRIECDREYPYQCCIFAGGYPSNYVDDDNNQMEV